MSEITCREMQVRRHQKKLEVEKPPKFVVTLQNTKALDTSIEVKMTSNMNEIFNLYPLEETLDLTLKRKTTLEEFSGEEAATEEEAEEGEAE